MTLLQACQGQETDAGSTVTERERRRRHTSQDNTTSTYKIPNYADFLIFQVFFFFLRFRSKVFSLETLWILNYIFGSPYPKDRVKLDESRGGEDSHREACISNLSIQLCQDPFGK